MCGEFRNRLRQVRETAAQSVEFEADDHVETTTAYVGHELVHSLAGELSAADHVSVFGDVGPVDGILAKGGFRHVTMNEIQTLARAAGSVSLTSDERRA